MVAVTLGGRRKKGISDFIYYRRALWWWKTRNAAWRRGGLVEIVPTPLWREMSADELIEDLRKMQRRVRTRG